ncbi:MAG: FAD-binding oxidoreductase [Candidatus Thermoplasmatota archaeon]|jgi:glycine/D-amino acid oxidase-like deaminating enzyme|nr:FAD-binding oxidoreductase [Candidatus Thermoplasmatota archaeon]
MAKYDVIIIGAGITGLSTAFHLKSQAKDLKIAVLEKAPTFAQGNTGKSAAAYRDLFTSDINRKISGSSIAFYRHLQNDVKYNVGMRSNGYLFLMDGNALDQPAVKTFVSEKRARIIDEGRISEIGIRTRPSKEETELMNLRNVEGGLFGINCGILEPDLLCSYYESECRKLGVEIHYNTEIEPVSLGPVKPLSYPGEPFVWQDVMLRSVKSKDKEFEADNFIFCADAWSTRLLDPSGIDSHTRPKKRQIFQISGDLSRKIVESPIAENESISPFIILPSNDITMRPEPNSRSLWISIADEYNRDFSFVEDPQPEPKFYEESIFPVLQSYLPGVEKEKITSSWAGYYSYNTTDRTHYIFREKNVIVATASSGSGIMKADAIGRVTASLYMGKERVKLFDNSEVNAADLGVETRRVPRENLVI